MKLFLVSVALLGCVALYMASPHTAPAAAAALVKSKVEPKEVILSKDAKDPNAAPVKTCRECHAQTGQKPAEWPAIPTVKYPDEDDETTLTNDEAYHRNCNSCHDDVKKRDPATKAPTTCAGCHNGGTKP